MRGRQPGAAAGQIADTVDEIATDPGNFLPRLQP